MVLEPIYLENISNEMVGFASTTARDMFDHLFLSYGSIADFDFDYNWEIYVIHGNHSNLWSPYSSRLRIASIM
jgi:hypothetical protein